MKTFIIVLSLCITLPLTAQKRVERNHKKTVSTIMQLAEQNICNPHYLKTEDWETFLTYIQSDEVKALDDTSFVEAFNKASEALPFTHFYIRQKNATQTAGNKTKKPPFSWKELDKETALLTISAFASNASKMITILKEIDAGGYKNLIIDLRDNQGGTLDAAVILARYLTNKPIDAGVYLTRKWYEQHEQLPSSEDINQFPFITDMSYKGFRKISQEEAFRMVLPPHQAQVFKGDVHVLTNKNTASTCEPVVYAVKKENLGTIVGETTAGAMLSAEWFKINKTLSIFIPTVDYITAEGKHIDKVGVQPDINAPSKEALDTVLKRIK